MSKKRDEIDEQMIIASFADTSPIRRQPLPKAADEVGDKVDDERRNKGTAPKRARRKGESYDELFLRDANVVARLGKSVFIRQEFHDRIIKIVQVVTKNEISIFSYIDNVLEHHFENYQDEITELYADNYEEIF